MVVRADPTKFTNPKPVGTGPFTLDKFAPTQYSLKKNPTYWQAAKIAPTEVVFPAQASNQSTNQLDVTSGKFDWSYTFLPDVQKTYVSRNSKHNAYWFPPGGVDHPVPQPDEGTVQRRQLPQGHLAVAGPHRPSPPRR